MTSVFAPAPAPVRPGPRARGGAAPAFEPRPRLDPAYAPRPNRRPVPAEPRRAPAEPRRHLRVVQPNERTVRRLTPKAGVALTALVFAVLFAVAGAHTLIAQGQIRLDGLDKRVAVEQARYQQLRKDVAAQEAPDRIVAAAEAQGMVAPQDLVYLQPDAGAAGSDDTADAEVASRSTDSSWDTVKPMLEAPAP